MKSLHRKMSWEEFENFAHRLGWKHEYYGGAIHLTPSKIAIVSFRLELGPKPEPVTWDVRSVGPADEAALRDLFVDAFADTIDYADYSRSDLRESGDKTVSRFFASKQGTTRAASCLAAEDDCVIGATLLIPGRSGPLRTARRLNPASCCGIACASGAHKGVRVRLGFLYRMRVGGPGAKGGAPGPFGCGNNGRQQLWV